MGRLRPWLCLALLISGCAPDREAARQAGEPLHIAAASDLQAALPAIVARFEQERGLRVLVSYGSSGNLARQIAQGAPFDLFLAANRQFVTDLADRGIIRPDSVRPYARGSLALAIHEGSGIAVTSLDDLRKPEIQAIALANPETAPYGAAGKQALERAGLWNDLQPKIAPAETVRQALQFVQTGNAEVGLVGRAIANVPGVRVVPIDPARYDPIIQALGIVARSHQTAAAEDFARYLLSEAGQDILARYGFSPPD
ncbi:MAG: molybdate ABC transporter substrate-binding protein [Isosphaeraceae bacterium]|nr:molybdate ABC transporter substrate-binding protein [Isosphaeraceae bacterium]